MTIPKIKMLVLSLTGKCNFACHYCYAAHHATADLSSDNAVAAVKLAAASGEKFVIQFSGGEPLLNFSCLHKVVEYVEENKINASMQIQTNGSLLTDEIAKYLYEHKIGIGISLDGKPLTNDKHRRTTDGKDSSPLIFDGLKTLKQNNIACGITCVVTSENVEDLAGIIDVAYYLGNVRRIGFDILRKQGRGINLNPPEPEKLREAMKKIYQRLEFFNRMAGYKIAISQNERAQTLCNGTAYEFGHCYAMNGESAFVDAKGDIYSCSSLIGDKNFYIGNVQSGIDMAKVAMIKKYIQDAMKFCRLCKDFKLCGGGCFARWYGNGAKTPCASECVLKRSSIKKCKK